MNAGPSRRGGKPKKYHLTDTIREALMQDYDSCNRQRFAARFGVPAWTISKWAGELGVRRAKERPWSGADEAYLEANIGRRGWRRMAKTLGRTEIAVRLKAKRLHLTKTKDGYTARALAALFGVDVHKVMRWIERGWLKAGRCGTDRQAAQGGDAYHVTRKALRTFLRGHPGEVDLRRVDRLWFLDLCLGSDTEGYGPASRQDTEGAGDEGVGPDA